MSIIIKKTIMKFDQAVIAAIIHDLQSSGIPFDEVTEEVGSVTKKTADLFQLLRSRGLSEDLSMTTCYLATKSFYSDRSLSVDEYVSALDQASLSSGIEQLNAIEFTILFRTAFKIDRFLLCLLTTDRVSVEWFNNYRKKFNSHLGKFIASISGFIDEVHAPNKKFLCINLTESFLSDNITDTLGFISKSPELTDIFIKDPDKLLVRVFSETVSQLELAFYASEELLG